MGLVTHIHISSVHIMQVYELNADKYNSNVEGAGDTVAKRPYVPTLSDAVQQQVTLITFQIRTHYNSKYICGTLPDNFYFYFFQEKALVNRYAETSAENTQRLNQMGLSKNLIALVK